MKNKSISFEDRIYALIYQVYEFSKKTNKYDDKMFMILGSLFMLHKDFIILFHTILVEMNKKKRVSTFNRPLKFICSWQMTLSELYSYKSNL